jgi:hypothetical protein
VLTNKPISQFYSFCLPLLIKEFRICYINRDCYPWKGCRVSYFLGNFPSLFLIIAYSISKLVSSTSYFLHHFRLSPSPLSSLFYLISFSLVPFSRIPFFLILCFSSPFLSFPSSTFHHPSFPSLSFPCRVP